MADKQVSPQPASPPADPIDLATSVAGEEDPGASIDRTDLPAAATPATPGTGPAKDADRGRK
ncbi:MAG: hypothetical protein ACO1PB_14100 [Ramlibacter sp.]